MKQLVTACTAAWLCAALPANAGQIDLTISGFSGKSGQARIVLMKGIAEYEGRKPVSGTVTASIIDGMAHWQGEVAPGRYVIIAHHDRDGDNALNRPLLGLPLEPYGYSQGAWTSLGLPEFKEAAFTVGQGTTPQHIHLRRNAFAAAAQIAAIAIPALLVAFVTAARLRRRRIAPQSA